MKKILITMILIIIFSGCGNKVENFSDDDIKYVGLSFVDMIEKSIITNLLNGDAESYDGSCYVGADLIVCDSGWSAANTFEKKSPSKDTIIEEVIGTFEIKNNLVSFAKVNFPQMSSNMFIYSYDKSTDKFFYEVLPK